MFSVLKLAKLGTLFDYLQNGAFNEMIICYIARQLFDGVRHMKDNGYAHRDIKLENVCLGEAFSIHLIDWGFAVPYRPGLTVNDLKGSECYMAPEVRA